MPLISIIMSVYNEEIYLKEALQSIFNQTIEDYELIIVDDCSTDRTVEIIKSFKENGFLSFVLPSGVNVSD